MIATILALQGTYRMFQHFFFAYDCIGGFGRLLVNLSKENINIRDQYEQVDKSVADVVNAWASLEKKGASPFYFWVPLLIILLFSSARVRTSVQGWKQPGWSIDT